MTDSIQNDETTQISIHSVKNLFGSEMQSKEFNEDRIIEFARVYGIDLKRQISEFGIELTDLQHKVMEAILNGFTRTRYKGNVDPLDKIALAREKYPTGHLPISYQNVEEIPKLKVTQADLLDWAGVDKTSPGTVQRALKALKHLGTSQYCFFYTRLAYDQEGHPKRDKDKGWQMEEVLAVDTLFTIKEIRDKKTHVLEYYEIIPSPIFLDQRENYFMLIPLNWREEVLSLVGQRRASSYTFRFLLYLRYQFTLQRRQAEGKRNFVLKVPPEEMAQALRMPESVYRRNKDRAYKILEDAYFVAKRLGYIDKYERTEIFDTFYFNEEKFSLPREKEYLVPLKEEDIDNSLEMQQAKELLQLMIHEKKKLDHKYNPIAGGYIRDLSLQHLLFLVKERGYEEVKKVIEWGMTKRYWCTRIGTPSKLRKYFHEAISEISTSGGAHKGEDGKSFALKVMQRIKNSGAVCRMEAFQSHVEIGDGAYPICISYEEKGFRTQLKHALKKVDISLDLNDL